MRVSTFYIQIITILCFKTKINSVSKRDLSFYGQSLWFFIFLYTLDLSHNILKEGLVWFDF